MAWFEIAQLLGIRTQRPGRKKESIMQLTGKLRQKRTKTLCEQIPQHRRVPGTWLKNYTPKKEVFLVSTGQYSDFKLRSVHSSEIAANAAQRLYPEGYNGPNEIEKFVLGNSPKHPPGCLLFYVCMKRCGEVDEVRRSQGFEEAEYFIEWIVNDEAQLYVWARDEQHAIKIANERRVFAIANGLWYDRDAFSLPNR